MIKMSKLNKYIPHQGKKECKRRLKQIRDGYLNGGEDFIPPSTRYAAFGLIYGG